MRHRVSGRKLSRTASHRRSLMRSLSTELIRHKRITTTEAKAKEASRFVESLITKAKRAHLGEKEGGEMNLAARRHLGKVIQDRAILRELFTEVAPKVATRPGGYTRVVRIGRRNGDGAEMAVLELVDYNLERDDSAARSRSKKTISRAERVKRSQQKQVATPAEEETATAEPEAIDPTDVVPEDAPVEAAPGYDNQSEEVASTEDPAEPQVEEETAQEIKKPAPEEGSGEPKGE